MAESRESRNCSEALQFMHSDWDRFKALAAMGGFQPTADFERRNAVGTLFHISADDAMSLARAVKNMLPSIPDSWPSEKQLASKSPLESFSGDQEYVEKFVDFAERGEFDVNCQYGGAADGVAGPEHQWKQN
jgi:hypothetical protein